MDKRIIIVLFIVTFVVSLLCSGVNSAEISEEKSSKHKVCLGTNYRITQPGSTDTQQRYDDLRQRYENCTYVDGNLEISWLNEGDNYDLSFLSSIEEVTGYVLILAVYSDVIPLTSLRVIRGKTLYESDDKSFALYVLNNIDPNDSSVGLRELQLTSLHEILKGDVKFYTNPKLCYIDTIKWSDIISSTATVGFTGQIGTKCPSCDQKCSYPGISKQMCWGAGPHMCQKLTKSICQPQCENRCFGAGPNDCCHLECAGGCTGPTKAECWACKNFENDGKCEPHCPPLEKYNQETYKMEPNPDAKFNYGSLCVDKCPAHMVVEGGSCVGDCGPGKIAKADRTCYECDGPCPKKCRGNDIHWMDATNIDQFEGCTIIQGSIKILKPTFEGANSIHPSALEVLKDVREISDYLVIQGNHPEFTNLDFLPNLQHIHGQHQASSGASLFIFGTSLHYLGLKSLKSVANGNIIVYDNPELCYMIKKEDWEQFHLHNANKAIRVDKNGNTSSCIARGHMCDEQCAAGGCWNMGADNCTQCKNFFFEGKCIDHCEINDGIFDTGNGTCQRCHEECLLTCTGPGNDDCDQCKNVKDGPYCVSKCPDSKYPDQNQQCKKCHENCIEGCTGPENNVGQNACNGCEIAVAKRDYITHNVTLTQCLVPDSECYHNTYSQFWNKRWGTAMLGKRVCLPCDPECDGCVASGYSTDSCLKCSHFIQGFNCVSNCSSGYFESKSGPEPVCQKCHEFCSDCYGPTQFDCYNCAHYKLYYGNDEDGHLLFNCTDECPDYAKYKHIDEATGDKLCVQADPLADAQKEKRRSFIGTIIGSVVGVVALTVTITLIGYFCWKRAKSLEREASIKAKLEGLEEDMPLTPTGASPDMSQMRIVKESELRMGAIIGSGAFGTVYKGVWIPENENVKIPIAIKVLSESSDTAQNTELLEEARVMASVNHPCCVRILGVCMTAQMMLITQLMPLGCLLEYVRKNEKNIGSKVLLNWCHQIAKGMQYLENRGIVHRDLAARNVLVHSTTRVKITDFGLSKMLDYNVEEFHESGGKMPIKWLALECIQHRLYTHKSDVWSFGVTIWELFTFGQKPYDNVRAYEVPALLSKGERLPQPPICTIDAYMILVKCWMLDASGRPSFADLVETFSKMARDPGRYLVIPGDEFLRLPSQSMDTKEYLLRNLSMLNDGPEEVISADDYLSPTGNTPPMSPLDIVVEADESGYINQPPNEPPIMSPTHQNFHPNNNHKPFFSRQTAMDEGGATARPTSPAKSKHKPSITSTDSFKGRYTADPCDAKETSFTTPTKSTDVEMDEVPNFPPPPPTPLVQPLGQPAAPKFTPQQPPLDDDNYLQPMSQQANPYLNIDEGSSEGASEGYMPMDKSGFQNPEYFNTPNPTTGRESSKPLLSKSNSEYKNL